MASLTYPSFVIQTASTPQHRCQRRLSLARRCECLQPKRRSDGSVEL